MHRLSLNLVLPWRRLHGDLSWSTRQAHGGRNSCGMIRRSVESRCDATILLIFPLSYITTSLQHDILNLSVSTLSHALFLQMPSHSRSPAFHLNAGHLIVASSFLFFFVAGYAILFSAFIPLTGLSVSAFSSHLYLCYVQPIFPRFSTLWPWIPTTSTLLYCLYLPHHTLLSQTGLAGNIIATREVFVTIWLVLHELPLIFDYSLSTGRMTFLLRSDLGSYTANALYIKCIHSIT